MYVYDKRVYVYGKHIYVYDKRMYVYDKRVYVYDKRIYVYDKHVYVYDKRMYVYDKRVYVYDKRVYVYDKRVYVYEKRAKAIFLLFEVFEPGDVYKKDSYKKTWHSDALFLGIRSKLGIHNIHNIHKHLSAKSCSCIVQMTQVGKVTTKHTNRRLPKS